LLNNINNVFFYVDNAKIHKAKIIRSLLSRLNIFYGPPYSPFIDICEECFALIKHFIRKTGSKKRYKLIMDTYAAINNIKKKHLMGFFDHSLNFFSPSLKK